MISAVAVLSDPHSSLPSYTKELLSDIICLKTKHKDQTLIIEGKPERNYFSVSGFTDSFDIAH